MNNEKIIKILKDGKIKLFNRWRSVYNIKQLDLSNVDLFRANLSGADLSDADLFHANLSGANLSDADLFCANSSGADLRFANLLGADLRFANLSGADLSDADLSGVNLLHANLSGVNLSGANLRFANLFYANLLDANLSDANLSGADLSYVGLSGVNVRFTNLSNTKFDETAIFLALQCPEEGAFIGWKKCNNNTIVKLLITEDAKRLSATSRKCRASKAKVLDVFDKEGNKIEETKSNYDEDFIYKKGEIIEIKNFDDNRWNECAAGIHFFITRAEAENY